jgi:hypothetical protein
MDNPLEVFIKNCIVSYKNLPFVEFTIVLRIAFMCFLFNVLMRIRKNYTTFKNCINKKEDTENIDTSLTKIEENIYKMDFVIDNQQYSTIIRKSEVYDNIEGIYTNDYEDCITSDVRPFFAFNQDRVYPRYLNKIYDRKDKCLIVTYKNKDERTIITDDQVYTESFIENDDSDIIFQEKILPRNVITDDRQVCEDSSSDS